MAQEKKEDLSAKKTERIKVYANQLQRDLNLKKTFIFVVGVVFIALIVVNIYLAVQGHVVVVGENFVSEGQNGFSSESKEVLTIRADGHARLLYDRFFSFDYNNFESQKRQAIYLGNESIEKVYQTLKKGGFYNQILSQHYRVDSFMDSTAVTFPSSNIIKIKTFGRMILTNDFYTEKRKLDLELSMRPITMVKGVNPFGLSIINIHLMSNKKVNNESK